MKRTLLLLSLICLAAVSCNKDDNAITDNVRKNFNSSTESKIRILDGILLFNNMDTLNSLLDNDEHLKSMLATLGNFTSYNDKVSAIFDNLDLLEIDDISYFEQDDISPYVKFITEFGEPSLVPTISSTLIGSVFNEDLKIIIGDELLQFDGKSSVSHYKILDFTNLSNAQFIKKREVTALESQPTLARANLDECSALYHDHNERQVVGKIGTTNILGGYRNDFTIKNQKKRWYGWTDYEADKLVLDGEITYDIDVCIDIDGNPSTPCQWFNNFYQGLSCSVNRTWFNTRRETANCSVVPPGGVGHEEYRQNLVGWDASYTVYDDPSTNWRATCTCVN